MKATRIRQKKYERTKVGFLMRKYHNMQSRVKGVQLSRAHIYLGLPILPKDDFYSWAFRSRTFHKLFADWVKSGYKRTMTPSVDRINGDEGYVKGNMRWLTNSENSRLAALGQAQEYEQYL